ncbi:MAG: DUF4382 domain-containing protein [Acidobacteriales bacterium]|nr:DUF4382 domain-containing protein [Terriglobales bacterium]
MSFHARSISLFLFVSLVASIVFLSSCGGGNDQVTPRMGTVSVTMSDPPSCSAPQGPFTHVFVTVRSVKIHQSDSADANAAGWIELAPGLAANPMQIDLFGQANAQCFLATLTGGTQIQAGTYQQIRLILADNATNVPNNACGNAGANCVVLAADPLNPRRLNLSSESQTGIKIPSGQLAGGRFTVAAGEAKDLNIDFNACASIVLQGNGQYRLKPVLHAGEASLQNSAAVSGKVVDSVTGLPIPGSTVMVALEQRDTNGVDRVVMETKADAQGNFSFCPVPAGTFDLVAVGIDGTGKAYAATIVGSVAAGNALGNVPLKIEAAANPGFATINGTVTSVNAANAPLAVDVSLSALQQVSLGGGNVLVTIPMVPQTASSLSLATAAGGTCPANTACATYVAGLPASNSNVGTFAGGGTTFTQAAGNASYTMEGRAFMVGSGGTADCTPSILTTTQDNVSQPLAVVAAGSVTAATLGFTGCQ